MDEKLKRAQSLVGTSEGRPDDDFYPTPFSGTRALLENETFEGPIWEPSCGEGHMCQVLEEYGYEVIATDLIDRGYEKQEAVLNFMDADEDLIVPSIITNPPFQIGTGEFVTKINKKTGEEYEKEKTMGCEHMIRKALRMTTHKVAMLQKLAFLESVERQQLFAETPFKACYVFSTRLTMTRNGQKMKNSGMIPFAWYVWEHGYEGEPVIRWVNHKMYI